MDGSHVIWPRAEQGATVLARQQLRRVQQPCPHRQGELYAERRRQSNANQEEPGGSGSEILQAIAELTSGLLILAGRPPDAKPVRRKSQRRKTMLARSFLSARDLGISEVERDALVATLLAFERGEIVNFTMRHFRETCG